MDRLSVVRNEAELEERTSRLVAHFLLCLECSRRTPYPFALLDEARDFVVLFAQKYNVPPDQTTQYPPSHAEYQRLLLQRLAYILEHISSFNPDLLEAALDELENWLTEDRVQSTPTEKTPEQQTVTRRRMRLTAVAILGLGISIAGPRLCQGDSLTPTPHAQQKSPQAPR